MLNTPNILSIFRLCLVPVFVMTYFSGIPNASIYAVCVYALATFTDFLDGYLARRFNLITNLGKVLDPLGDKMFTFSVLVCICIDKIIPFLFVGIFFCKEAFMGIGGLIIHRKAKVEIPPSNIFGKAATVLFFLVCVLLLLWEGIPGIFAVSLICLCLAVSIVAFATYIKDFRSIMKNSKPRA
jgi:CDP-diacylglycerol--glycerol-3-phosphate 3-phosphatidyltransferase